MTLPRWSLFVLVVIVALARSSSLAITANDAAQLAQHGEPNRRADVLVTNPGGSRGDADTQPEARASFAKPVITEDDEGHAENAAVEDEEEDIAPEEEASKEEDEAEEDDSETVDSSLIENEAHAETSTSNARPAPMAKAVKKAAKHALSRRSRQPRFSSHRRHRTGEESAGESAQSPSWILPLAPAGYGGPGVINPYSNVNPLNPMAAQMQAEAGGNGAGGPPQAQMGPAQNNNAGVTPSSFIEIQQRRGTESAGAANESKSTTASHFTSTSSTSASSNGPSQSTEVDKEPIVHSLQQVSPSTSEVESQQRPAELQQQAVEPQQTSPSQAPESQAEESDEALDDDDEEEGEEESKPQLAQVEQPQSQQAQAPKGKASDSLAYDREFMKNIEKVFQDVVEDAHERRANLFSDESSHILDLSRWDALEQARKVLANQKVLPKQAEQETTQELLEKRKFNARVEKAIQEALVASSSPLSPSPSPLSSSRSSTFTSLPVSFSDVLLKDDAVTTTPDSAPIDAEPLPSNIQPALPPVVSDITEIRDAFELEPMNEVKPPLAFVVKSPLPSSMRTSKARRRARFGPFHASSPVHLNSLFEPLDPSALMPFPILPFFSPRLKLMIAPSRPTRQAPNDFSWPVVHNTPRITEEKDANGHLIALRNLNHQDSEEDQADDRSRLMSARAELAKDMTQLVQQLVMPRKSEEKAFSKPARLEVVQVTPVDGGVIIRDEKIQDTNDEDDDDDDDNNDSSFKSSSPMRVSSLMPTAMNPLAILGASLGAGGISPFPSLVEVDECKGCEYVPQELDQLQSLSKT